MQSVDYDGNGEINYSEFLSGTINESHLTEENLKHLFNYLDANNEKLISKEGLAKVFQRSGKVIDEAEIIEMLKELEIGEDESIDF